jgi:hypothetical protein
MLNLVLAPQSGDHGLRCVDRGDDGTDDDHDTIRYTDDGHYMAGGGQHQGCRGDAAGGDYREQSAVAAKRRGHLPTAGRDSGGTERCRAERGLSLVSLPPK